MYSMLSFLMITLVSLSGCKKDEEEAPPQSTPAVVKTATKTFTVYSLTWDHDSYDGSWYHDELLQHDGKVEKIKKATVTFESGDSGDLEASEYVLWENYIRLIADANISEDVIVSIEYEYTD